MIPGRRLLILSCSQRKRSDPDLLPAIQRYDGPPFRVLRRFMQEQPDSAKQLDVLILSAAYGLLPAEYPITRYDQVMTSKRAAELHDDVLAIFTSLFHTGYIDLCFAMGRSYLSALEGWSALVPPTTSVTITNGAQGLRLAQLKRWLRRERADNIKHKQKAVKRAGVAHLRGIELRLTPAQVLERARTALAEDRTGADCFRQWYAEVGSDRVAPKWLVSKLTGLPVRNFTAGEARRTLNRLGIKVQRFDGKGRHQ